MLGAQVDYLLAGWGRAVLQKTDVSKPADVNGPVDRTVATLITHSVN